MAELVGYIFGFIIVVIYGAFLVICKAIVWVIRYLGYAASTLTNLLIRPDKVPPNKYALWAASCFPFSLGLSSLMFLVFRFLGLSVIARPLHTGGMLLYLSLTLGPLVWLLIRSWRMPTGGLLMASHLGGWVIANHADLNPRVPVGAVLGSVLFLYFFAWLDSLVRSTFVRIDGDDPITVANDVALPPSPVTKPNQSAESGQEVARPVVQVTRSANNEDEQAAPDSSFDWSAPRIGLDSLAGMAELKAEIRAAIAGFRGYANQGRVADRNGILLSGPPGNGKTAMAQAIAGELGLRFVKVGVQDLTSKWINESPSIIRELFRQAATAPCVLFIDEFDSVAASRGGDSGSAEDRKVVNTLLSEIDKARTKRIVLLAATNFPEDIDPAIARDGRFDFRIEIPYPDQEAREAILGGMLKKFNVRVTPTTVRRVAQLWERRSVSFIESVAKRLRDDGKGRDMWPASIEDFKAASRAASRRASAIPSSGAKLSEIALPARVREAGNRLLYRLRNWETIAERGGDTPSGILLYGPPGTGKTNFVRALARELGYWHVFEVNASEVIMKPRKFREIVELAAQHRPAFVFIDEADELLRDRSSSHAASATNEILKAMDGMMGKVPEVVFIAATNNMDVIDTAALRGGRFAEKIHMPLLSGDDLVGFLEKELDARKNRKLAVEVTAEQLAHEFGEIAPSDAISLIREATNYTFDENGDKPLSMAHVRRAREALQC